MATKRKDKSRVVLKTGEVQRKDGTYQFSWQDSQMKRRFVYARTLDDLREKEKRIQKDKCDGIKTEARYTTIVELFDLWANMKRGLKNNTFENYKYMYNTFVRPVIGSKRISTLKKSDIKKYYNYLVDERNLKPSTIDNIHTVLHQVLQIAVDDDFIRNNPSDNVLRELKKQCTYCIGKTMICTTNCTLTTARIDAKSKFNTIFFKEGIDNAEICSIIVVWGITTMNNYEFLEKLGFSSNEAKVYGTLIKHKVLNGYEIAKLSGVARSLVYEVINRLVAKGAVIRIDGEPNFYKPIEYQDLIRSIKEENEKNIACAERELQQLATENADVDYVMNIVGEEKYVAKAKELIDSAQAEISLSIWRESFEVLRSNIENAISRGVKVYIFTFESISVAGATVYSYNINDVSTLFPYRRTTIIIDGGECLVGEEGDRNVYVHTRNHSVVSLATDEIVLNVFWNKLIEKENLLSKGCSGADFLQAIHNLAERYGITDEMTKNFLVYNFQKEKTQNGKKC